MSLYFDQELPEPFSREKIPQVRIIVSPTHPAGDVTRVSVMPRNVTVKIGGAENRCQGCGDKNQ